MSNETPLVTSKILQKLRSYSPLVVGLIFFMVVLGLYFAHFGVFEFRFWENLSNSKSEWGAFGDFMGGLVNPILALVTVWLLSKSLIQNSEMLEAAKDELRLAREEIERGIAIQRQTEKALRFQNDLAQQEKDFNILLALKDKYQKEASETDSDSPDYNSAAHKRNKFLGRYIDAQFSAVLEKAKSAGIDPIVEFGTTFRTINRKFFKFQAFHHQVFVRISNFAVPTTVEFEWFDHDNTALAERDYIKRNEYMLESAIQALTHYLALGKDIRDSEAHSIPGLRRVRS